MKGIRKILLIHRVERPVNPLFEAILRQAVLSDLTLLTAGVCTDSAEIDLSEEDIVEDRQPLPAVQSVLYLIGFQNYSYQSNTCVNVINKLATSPVFYTCRDTQIRAKSQELTAVMKSPQSDGETITKTKKPVMPKVQTIFPDADNTIEIVVRNAKAVVCSRGTGGTTFYDIPYIYSCIGATELIRDNQLIIVDSARGEVYDPAHFGQSKQNGLLIAH